MYNVSIYDQKNETECIPLPGSAASVECEGSHQYMTFPSLVGDLDWNMVHERADYFQNLRSLAVLLMSTEQNGTCYQHVGDLICKGMIPICDPVRKVMVPMCSEMCTAFIDSCIKQMASIMTKQSTLPSSLVIRWLAEVMETGMEPVFIDCNYLPSVTGSIPCFYKNVTCNPPPVVPNAEILGLRDAYTGLMTVQYVCSDESMELKGPMNSTCLV